MHTQHNPAPRVGIALRVLGVLLTASLHAADAGAVFIDTTPATTVGAITMRVGSTTAVDTVTFATISSSNISPSPSAVAYGADVTVEALAEFNWVGTRTVTVTANSLAGLACTGGGCGATVIPFSEICWVSTNKVLGGGDIQDGCFTGIAVQPLAAFSTVGNTNRLMRNFLRFSYQNSRVYPAGNYRGTVTYTATLP
jgi:hypothetical protein